MAPVRLSAPDITDAEIAEVVSVLKTPTLSLGPKLTEFESAIAEYTGARHAIAVNSGTSGLHLCMEALGIGPGDDVVTTPFSFIASANCILFQGARPIFVDICENTMNLDTDQIPERITWNTKAIVGVDVFGLPAEWDRLENLAKRLSLGLVEDSCEALGARLRDRKTGTFGHCGVFAFYPNKQITTGEGGVIVTNSDEIAALCRSMRNQGRESSNQWLTHTRVGYNYRLSELNCALGVAQMRRIEEILAKRDRVAQMYQDALDDIDEVTAPISVPGLKRSWFVYVIKLAAGYTRDERDSILEGLRAQGIECGNYFPPIHLQPLYRDRFGYKPGDFPVTESVSARTIALPFHNHLTEDDIARVVSSLKDELASLRRSWVVRLSKVA